MKRLLLILTMAILALTNEVGAQYTINYKKIHGADSLIAASDCFATDFIPGNYEYIDLFVDATTPAAGTHTKMKITYQGSRDGITWYGDADDEKRINDSTFVVDSLITLPRGKIGLQAVTHILANYIRFLFYSVDGDSVFIKSIGAEYKGKR